MIANGNVALKKVLFNTGNILKASKKAGQRPTEELLESLQHVVAEPETEQLPSDESQINWRDNDLLVKLKENTRESIKVATKLFLNECSEKNVRAAIDHAFRILDTDYLDTLILAYHPRCGSGSEEEEVEVKEGVIEWGDGTEQSLENLKKLWCILEEYSEREKIRQLGVSDLNAQTLTKLFDWAKVKPTITQINLSACCVVPTDLKEFCNEKDIQLLTHSDPQQIISKSQLTELNLGPLEPRFCLRYQVHVKCRGVLITKGFIVGAHA